MRIKLILWITLYFGLVPVILPGMVLASNGYFLHGVGAVNEALGGAATAGNVQDVLGSLYRNPASAVLFNEKAAAISFGAIFPDVTVDSAVTALGLSGSSESDVDLIPLGNLGVVCGDPGRATAYYVAVIGEAGLHLDIPESRSNPIFIPQAGAPNNPFGGLFGGFGAVETQMELVRIAIGAGHALDDKWSVGFSLAPSVARLKFTPAAFVAPDDADGNGIPTYPTDVDHTLALGIGFQAGVRYQASETLSIGFTATSPTWFEDFEWDVADENGNPRNVAYRCDRPLTLHLGVGWQVTPATLLLVDGSWINYSDTDGFDGTGFAADGSLPGLGWDDQWVLAVGVQQAMGDQWVLRAGYNYGTNPIDDASTFFNVGTPLHNEHHLSLGVSWKISQKAILDLGYTHAFESSQSGAWYNAANQAVPGTRIESSLEYDQVSLGATFFFRCFLEMEKSIRRTVF